MEFRVKELRNCLPTGTDRVRLFDIEVSKQRFAIEAKRTYAIMNGELPYTLNGTNIVSSMNTTMTITYTLNLCIPGSTKYVPILTSHCTFQPHREYTGGETKDELGIVKDDHEDVRLRWQLIDTECNCAIMEDSNHNIIPLTTLPKPLVTEDPRLVQSRLLNFLIHLYDLDYKGGETSFQHIMFDASFNSISGTNLRVYGKDYKPHINSKFNLVCLPWTEGRARLELRPSGLQNDESFIETPFTKVIQ